MAALAHSRELTNIPSPARPGVENPEEPFPATKEQVERLIAEKIIERIRICATLNQEIETMRRFLGQTVNPVAHAVDNTSEIQLLREHFERRKKEKESDAVDNTSEIQLLREHFERRKKEKESEQRAAEGIAANRRSREAARLSLDSSPGHRFSGGRRRRRKSQSRKKLSKRRKTKKKKRRRKSCKRCKKKRRY